MHKASDSLFPTFSSFTDSEVPKLGKRRGGDKITICVLFYNTIHVCSQNCKQNPSWKYVSAGSARREKLVMRVLNHFFLHVSDTNLPSLLPK